jgi:hypothetical protein
MDFRIQQFAKERSKAVRKGPVISVDLYLLIFSKMVEMMRFSKHGLVARMSIYAPVESIGISHDWSDLQCRAHRKR